MATLGGVITSVEPLAAEAGAEMLEAGGNATDAAVATAFAQGVVDPIYCGIGGGFHGIFHDAATGRTEIISAGGVAPRAARADMWTAAGRWGAMWSVEGERNRYGYQASMVPGFVRGAWEAFSRFGSGAVTWQQVIEPAVRLAADGFRVSPYVYRVWMPPTARMLGFLESGDGPTVLGQTEACRAIYLKPDGSVYGIGEMLLQADYARTLARIAEQGADEFYVGETARRMVDDFARNGGLIDADDLATFAPTVGEPLRGTFRDLEILTEPAPTVGPVTLEVLAILEGWDLRSLGWNTGAYLDRLAGAMHAAFRDRHEVLGDPAFVDVPVERLLSADYVSAVRARIEQGGWPAQPGGGTPVASGTTHVSVMDSAGNVAAITHSLGMSSGVVTEGLGFQHNCHMVMFDPVPGRRNSIEPGKRPITGGGPVLFIREGRPWLVIGSPAGARKVTAIVQALLDMEDFGMSIEAAVAAERIHVEDEERVVIVEPHFSPEPLMELAARGYDIRYEWYTARLGAVTRDPVSGALDGASDPRGGRGIARVTARP
jgi:gamma-glutamyltranspeptidase/glutathione hydrolase